MSQNNVLPDEVIAAPIKPKRKSPVIGILIAIAVIALVAIAGYAWYTTSGPCGTKPVAAAVQSLAEVHDDFDDYYKIASSTSRIALTGPVVEMQSIKKETLALVVPTCLDHARSLLVDSMTADIDGFLFFMTEESDELIISKMETAADLRQDFYAEIARVKKCTPFCK